MAPCVPTVTNIVNFLLSYGQFHPISKNLSFLHCLRNKYPTFDKDELCNCYLICNLSVIFKIIEHVITSRVIDHFTHLDPVLMALFSTGSSLTYHLTPSVLNVITTSCLVLIYFLQWCSPRLCCQSSNFHHLCTLPLSVLSSPLFPWPPPLWRRQCSLLLFPSTQLWLKHYSPSKWTSTDLFLDDCFKSFKFPKTELTQNTIFQNITTPHSMSPTLLAISVSSLINTSPLQARFHLSSKPSINILVIFTVCGLSSIPQLPVPLPLPFFTPNLITVILFTTNFLSVWNNQSPTDSKLSCTCCSYAYTWKTTL